MKYYFTYGTLMNGMERNDIFQIFGEYVGDFRANGYRLYDYCDGNQNYPVAIHTGSTSDVVVGEIWKTEYDLTDYLDQMEGAPDLYTREIINIDSFCDNIIMYVGNLKMWGNVLEREPYMMKYPSGVKWTYRTFKNLI